MAWTVFVALETTTRKSLRQVRKATESIDAQPLPESAPAELSSNLQLTSQKSSSIPSRPVRHREACDAPSWIFDRAGRPVWIVS